MTTATINRYVDDAVTGGEIPDGHIPQFDKISDSNGCLPG
jgi:hypothetical protein